MLRFADLIAVYFIIFLKNNQGDNNINIANNAPDNYTIIIRRYIGDAYGKAVRCAPDCMTCQHTIKN